MKKTFKKNETLFCILLIVIYIVVNSYCMQNFGISDYRSTLINTIFSILLILLIKILRKTSYYGLIKAKNTKKFMCFIPLLLIVSVNLWNGININNSIIEIVFYILTMINIGFIEEILEGKVKKSSSSTDCNIPLSMGIPAIAIGVREGDGIHTRGEWLYRDSMVTGLEIFLNLETKLLEV